MGRIELERFVSDGGAIDETTTGYGLNLSGRRKLGKRDSIMEHLAAGSGIGRYIESLGGTDSDEAWALTADGSGNICVVGRFAGDADFDPGLGVFELSATGSRDGFVLKLDANGYLVWAGHMGGSTTVAAFDVALAGSGSVHVVGRFSGTADFDPGPGEFNLSASGGDDAFVLKLDGSGDFLWARHVGHVYSGDVAYGVAVDDSGNVHIGGGFRGTASPRNRSPRSRPGMRPAWPR